MTTNVLVSGIKAAGSTLKAKLDLSSASNVSYIWVSVDNTGTHVLSTSASYKLTAADISKTINVVASYKTADGLQTATHSSVLADLNQQHTGGISIKGATTIGSTLSVASTLADKDGLGDFIYSWTVPDGNGGTTTLGTGSTYKITSTELGKQISAVVTYTDSHGYSETSNTPMTNKVSYSTVKSSLDDHITATTPSKALSGGAGNDTFIFTAINDKSFKITDFTAGDKIDVSAIDAIVGGSKDPFVWLSSAPTLANTSAVGGSSEVLGAKGALWFDPIHSTLYGSVDSDIAPEFSVVLTGVTSLTSANVSV
jgi:hypothetical protein